MAGKLANKNAHKVLGQKVGLLPGKAGELGLSFNQRLFCEIFTSQHFGNGVQSYMKAFAKARGKSMSYSVAQNAANELLTLPYIREYINHLLEQQQLSDELADSQLGYLIRQHENLYVKLGGITEYNKLKKRVGNNTPEGNKTLIIVVSPETAERYNLTPTEVTQK